MDTGPIPNHHRQWFDTLVQAANAGHLALMSCQDAQTGEQRSVICAVNQYEDETIGFVPLGHMATTDNPFDAYVPAEDMTVADATVN